jgi:hypothetical protein
MASITGDTLQEQIQKAISAHGVFKFKLSHMVEAETGEIQPPTASADYHCAVGQWLHESLPESVRRTDRYRVVVDLHARFHRAAGEVASLSMARRRTEALEAMEPTSTFKKASDQLIAALDAWAEAVAGGGSAAGSEAGGGMDAGTSAAPAEEPAAPAEEPAAEGGGEVLPAGWWQDSPKAPAAEAQEAVETEGGSEAEEAAPVDEVVEAPAGADDQAAETEEPAMADGPRAEGSSESEGETSISDWFGLPRSGGQGNAGSQDEPAEERGQE